MIYGLRVSWAVQGGAFWLAVGVLVRCHGRVDAVVTPPGVGLRISAGQIEVRF